MVCKNCGTDFDEAQNKNENGEIVCPNCGNACEPEAVVSVVKDSKKHSVAQIIGIALVLLVVVLILVLSLGGNAKKGSVAEIAKSNAGGKYTLYQLDVPATLDKLPAKSANDENSYSYENEMEYQLQQIKETWEKDKNQYSVFIDSLGLEFDNSGEIYAIVSIDDINKLYQSDLVTVSYEPADVSMTWSSDGSALRLTSTVDIHHEDGYETWQYNEEVGYETWVEIPGPSIEHQESIAEFSYSITGRTLTVSGDRLPFILRFTRIGKGKTLAGTWKLDIPELIENLNRTSAMGSSAVSFLEKLTVGPDEFVKVLLNTNGTIGIQAKIKIGSCADGSITLRDEIQSLLDESGISLALGYEKVGSRMELSAHVYDYSSYYTNYVGAGTVVLKRVSK